VSLNAGEPSEGLQSMVSLRPKQNPLDYRAKDVILIVIMRTCPIQLGVLRLSGRGLSFLAKCVIRRLPPVFHTFGSPTSSTCVLLASGLLTLSTYQGAAQSPPRVHRFCVVETPFNSTGSQQSNFLGSCGGDVVQHIVVQVVDAAPHFTPPALLKKVLGSFGSSGCYRLQAGMP